MTGRSLSGTTGAEPAVMSHSCRPGEALGSLGATSGRRSDQSTGVEAVFRTSWAGERRMATVLIPTTATVTARPPTAPIRGQSMVNRRFHPSCRPPCGPARDDQKRMSRIGHLRRFLLCAALPGFIPALDPHDGKENDGCGLVGPTRYADGLASRPPLDRKSDHCSHTGLPLHPVAHWRCWGERRTITSAHTVTCLTRASFNVAPVR